MIFWYPDDGMSAGAESPSVGTTTETTAAAPTETAGAQSAQTGTAETKTDAETKSEGMDKGTFTDPYEGIKYRSQLSKEASENKEIMDSIKDYPTVSDLASGFSKAKADWANEKKGFEERLNKAIEVPAIDAPNEEWETFMKKMDIPLKPEEYAFADPKDGYIDTKSDEYKAFKDYWAKRAMKLGLSKRQGRGMWDTAVAMLNVEGKQSVEGYRKAVDSFDQRQDDYLKKDYPVDAERKAQMNEDRNNFAELVREADLGAVLRDTGLALNPVFMHKMAEFYKSVKAKGAFGRSEAAGDDGSVFKHGTDWNERYGR